MSCPSCLNDTSEELVLDASVIINLRASGDFSGLLAAMPNSFVISEEVRSEIENGRSRGYGDSDVLAEIIQRGQMTVLELGNDGQERFLDLVSGPSSETLDDGEAATIALALERGAVAIMDERKARRICGQRFPDLQIASTVDLFFHSSVSARIGQNEMADAVFKALKLGRMRILERHREAVVELIGVNRASQCSSLSKFLRNKSSN